MRDNRVVTEQGTTAIPDALADIRDEFLALGLKDRLQLLLEFSNELPELPDHLRDKPDLFEQVVECQSPVFIDAEIEDGAVHLHATAPRESPTTRGFASILVQGVSGLAPAAVLAIPNDFPQMLGLGEAVSPLRLRGMSGMLARTKRQIAAKSAA
jgi:cysteine desulfuration protein SufE